MKLWIINGPNLNLLGVREPNIYGAQSYRALQRYVKQSAKALGIQVKCMQSNHEGELVTWIHKAYRRADGIIINPAAYTHTSIALLDALKAVALPAVEVHLSDVAMREEYRKVSYIAETCQKTISGHGFQGYREAMEFLISLAK